MRQFFILSLDPRKSRCPSMIKSSLEFYPPRMKRSPVGKTLTKLTPSPSILLSSFRFYVRPRWNGGNVVLSSIVFSRRCGLVCAKSSEIIDTSSSTPATWNNRDAISFPPALSFIPFPRDSFYRVTCNPSSVFRSLARSLPSKRSSRSNSFKGIVKKYVFSWFLLRTNDHLQFSLSRGW